MGIEAAIIGGALIGGGASILGSRQAAREARRGADAATAEARRQFDIQREDQLPFIETGQSVLARLRAIFGLTRGDEPGGAGDFSFFEESPGFQFVREQGQEAIDRSAASRGKLLSGQAVQEGIRFAGGIASQEFGNFFDRLSRLAGIGQGAAGQSAAAGVATAGQVGSAELTGGLAAANSRLSGFQGLNNAFQGGLSNFLLLNMLQGSPATTPATTPGGFGGIQPGILPNPATIPG